MSISPAILQSGVVPFVIATGELYVCLIRMMHLSGTEGWELPKGGVEPRMSLEDSAAKESDEEAGLLGKVEYYLGATEYSKANGHRQHVSWFSLRVEKTKDEYDESGIRVRQWFKADLAQELIHEDLAFLIRKLRKRHVDDKLITYLPEEMTDELPLTL